MGRPYKYTLEELQENCASENLTVLGRALNPTFLIVKCDICGTVSEKHDTCVLKSFNSRCDVCFENSIRRDASSLGMVLIGKSSKENKSACDFRKYKLSCGHIKEFSISRIRQKYVEPRCIDCVNEEIQHIVENDHGFKFIEKTKPHRVTVECRTCSTIFHPQVSNLKHGRSVSCPGCSESSFEKSSYLYLFEISVEDFNFLKLGYSLNPHFRSSGYKLPSGAECNLLISVNLKTARLAKKVEQHLLTKYSDYRINRTKVDVYMKSGFTECLQIACKGKLQDELTKLSEEPTMYLKEVKDAH